MIKIGDSVIPWNDSFRFYMTTKVIESLAIIHTIKHYYTKKMVTFLLFNYLAIESPLPSRGVCESFPG